MRSNGNGHHDDLLGHDPDPGPARERTSGGVGEIMRIVRIEGWSVVVNIIVAAIDVAARGIDVDPGR